MAELHNPEEFHQYYSRVDNASVSSDNATTDSRLQDSVSYSESVGNCMSAEKYHSPDDIFGDQNLTSAPIFGDDKYDPEVPGPSSDPSQDPRFKLGREIFLLVAVISAFLVLALEAFMFGVITKHRQEFFEERKYYEMSIYLALFIFAGIYQVIITLIALYTKNMLLFAMLCLFYAVMLVYTGIQYHELSQQFYVLQSKQWSTATHATNIATICVLAATLVIQVSVIYFLLWNSVRWYSFKKIGASFEIKRLYSFFQIHRSLLIFDFFFFLGFTVQFLVIMVKKKNSVEFILTCCMLPLTILVLYASDFAATKEWMLLTIATICCFLGGVVYVLFKIIRLYTRYTSAFRIAVVPGEYFPGRTSLVAFGVITLIFLFATLVMEGFMIYGYNKGLLPLVDRSREATKNSAVDRMADDADLID